MNKKKYDIGVLGLWHSCNYGGVLTYYGLHETLKSLGFSVLMISKINASLTDPERGDTFSMRFARMHYNISKYYTLSDISELNDLCDAFIVGSDQLWNYGISKNFGKAYYLDFAYNTKHKISYSTSFGHSVDFAPPEERKNISGYMKCFNAISVREKSGVRLCRDIYDVKATQVLDPILLCGKKLYEKLAEKSLLREKKPYVLSYILDPTPEKRRAMLYIAEHLGLKLIHILDGLPWKFEGNKKALDLDGIAEDVESEDFVYLYLNANFVITDSFHGTVFALLFNKPFVTIGNKMRGMSRFDSLFEMIENKERFTTDAETIIGNEKLFEALDYEKINSVLKEERKKSLDWLKNALPPKRYSLKWIKKTLFTPPSEGGKLNITPKKIVKAFIPYGILKIRDLNKNEPIQPKPNDKMPPAKSIGKTVDTIIHPDIERCRIVVSLCKTYNIKHIVISSGTRNVSLVRLFEANNDFFKIYHVTDERSAGFFALGLSIKLGKQPVGMCCTSGTAASNYLSAITEAFYQHVPLIAITADRYPCFLGQMEDQTIPQPGMYGAVCKKSVTLPINGDYFGKWETRLLTSEAILEATHHSKGPVQINVPINYIERMPPTDLTTLKLPPLRIIQRITLESGSKIWDDYITVLHGKKRVLIVVGQYLPPSPELRNNIDVFVKKYNCVITTDHLSNYHSEKSLHTYLLFNHCTQEEFNQTMSPDLVISIGDKQVMNNPTGDRLRGAPQNVDIWRVSEDGAIVDPYRKLTAVFECSDNYFFKYFAEHAGNIKNTNEYFSLIKKSIDQLDIKNPTNYFTDFTLNETMKRIPPNSTLHLAVGNTFMMSQRYALHPSVEVFCNMGTNGIDGCVSTFMGQAAVTEPSRLCFLLVGDLSFFYDMNSLWNKNITGNIRILLNNDGGAGLLRHHRSPGVTQAHETAAEGWVKSLGFKYLSAKTKEEFEAQLSLFVSSEINEPLFFEVFFGVVKI
ncbi:2-oxoglutarate decarboxylase [Treponema primitia ZAS-2]|uniref:2-oxoglutarate decarboxylase n=1 Tax=Treponema primitia (strain ATCC BAA-887 / DSM 12427 / ZAS-2) TaxID=545694 RepID=F5YGN7_TREPZ|nr:polysaccharide pyruvyl transferase family protein [Treponema primitia]AEF84645.1 2-oxoglutarate decarboxylase [Treponema primitia ZAS-2]